MSQIPLASMHSAAASSFTAASRAAARRAGPATPAASSSIAINRMPRSASTAAAAARALSTAAGTSVPVLGCGSNVVDVFYALRAMPASGTKGYFKDSPNPVGTVVGGATLNHLAWAQLLRTPTGLLALQGTDTTGVTIREELERRGMSTAHIQVSPSYVTSISAIFNDAAGERTIMMAPAATSLMNAPTVLAKFDTAVASAKILSTEISQVPMSGVLALLRHAKASGVRSVLDVDVPPSVATGDAQLGTYDELRACISTADVVKFTDSATAEVLELVSREKPASTLHESALQLGKAFGNQLVAITAGSQGSAFAAIPQNLSLAVPISKLPADAAAIDSTGCGDAFLGAMIAALYHWGMPSQLPQLTQMGKLSAAAGAACVTVLGGLPGPNSFQLMERLEPQLMRSIAALPVPVAKAGTRVATPSVPTSSTIASLKADATTLAGLANAYESGQHVNAAALEAAAKVLVDCSNAGRQVFTTGVGKSGIIADRAAASWSSLNVPTHAVHGVEWVHGDLGRLRDGDALVLFSHSGATQELCHLIPPLRRKAAIKIIAIIGAPLTAAPTDPALAKLADHVVYAPTGEELLGKVPSRSIVAQEAIINAFSSNIVALQRITDSSFMINHPGGAIGANAAK